MEIHLSKELDSSQKEAVLRIWNAEYATQLAKTMEGFEEYLSNLGDPKHFLMMNEAEEIMGWAFSFDREEERWFAILLDGSVHGKGYGRQLLNAVKEHEPILNGWVTDHDRDIKQNGAPYQSPVEFYRKNDFEVLGDVRLEIAVLSAVKIRWTNK